MNVHERFKKMDALDKNKKPVPSTDGEALEAVNHPEETTGEFLSPVWKQKGTYSFDDPTDGEALEMVDHPNHYGGQKNPYEAINIIEAWGLDFHCGSVIKYIARHKKKGSPREDIDKAIWYLQRYRDECLGE